MSNINIKTEGLEHMEEKLRKVARDIDLREPTYRAGEIILRKTKSNLPEGAKSLSIGVRYSFNEAKAAGKVHIMGDWRLRFFEKGTEQRQTRKGHNTGRMKAYWFFKKANDETRDQAIEAYKKSFSEQLNKIWEDE